MARAAIALTLSLLFALGAGCSSSSPRRYRHRGGAMLARAHTPATRIELERGMTYTVRHRWRVRVEGEEILSVVSRGTMVVENVEQSGSAQVRVVFVRPGRHGDPEAWIAARLSLSPDGRVSHDPTVLCEGHALELERTLRHLVMPAAVQAQVLESELIEEEIPSEVEIARSERSTELRARGSTRVSGVELGVLHVSGTAFFTLQARLGSDGLSGRRRLRTHIDGTLLDRDTAHTRHGEVDVESDAIVERVSGAEPALSAEATACVARVLASEEVRIAGPTYDPDQMRQAVEDVMRPMRVCYERDLRLDSALNGRLEMSVTFDVDGHATARVLSSTFESPRIGQCVVGVLREIHVSPPPPSADTYTFPLVFEPEASGRSARFAAIEEAMRAAGEACHVEMAFALDVTIAADGRVTAAAIVAGPADSTEEGECLLERVEAARAPATSAYTEERTQRIRIGER